MIAWLLVGCLCAVCLGSGIVMLGWAQNGEDRSAGCLSLGVGAIGMAGLAALIIVVL